MGYLEFIKMALQQDRTEWRQQLISELLKHNAVYGKETIDGIINNAKKIESFVFQDVQQQPNKTD